MGRPLYHRNDLTMRFIAKKNLFAAVAAQCGITPGAVRMWQRVPEKHVHNVAHAIGRRRSLIRPDLFRFPNL